MEEEEEDALSFSSAAPGSVFGVPGSAFGTVSAAEEEECVGEEDLAILAAEEEWDAECSLHSRRRTLPLLPLKVLLRNRLSSG